MTSKSSVRWKPVLACVLLIVAAALLWPQVQLPHNHPLLIALAAGALLFQVRKRWLDVGFLLACVMAAEQLVESDFAPLLLLMLLMVALALSMRPWFSALLAMCVVGLLWFSAQMKLRFAGSALTWQDAKYFFRQFADNVGVMRTQPTLLLAAAGALSLVERRRRKPPTCACNPETFGGTSRLCRRVGCSNGVRILQLDRTSPPQSALGVF